MEKKISLKLGELEIILGGRPKKSVRTGNGWTDWMIDMGDIRDMVIEIDNRMADELFKSLTTGYKRINYVSISKNEEEFSLSKSIKIVRRTGPGLRRKEYQTVSIFIKNLKNEWPPSPFTITLKDLSRIMNALITLDKPEEHCMKDSLRNYQYLLSMLWMKKTDAKLLKGQRKLSARNIFRLGIP
jgi:hypothetical protein